MFRPLAGALLLAATVACADAADTSNPDGAAAYQRCAACHLPGGEGIPGAFPPLKGRIAAVATSEEGRAYLVAVIQGGLMGSITVNGTPYMGVMPAQGASYDAQGISQVLNYTVQVIDADNVPAQWTPFTADEVTRLLEANPKPSGQGSATLRQALLKKHPELQ